MELLTLVPCCVRHKAPNLNTFGDDGRWVSSNGTMTKRTVIKKILKCHSVYHGSWIQLANTKPEAPLELQASNHKSYGTDCQLWENHVYFCFQLHTTADRWHLHRGGQLGSTHEKGNIHSTLVNKYCDITSENQKVERVEAVVARQQQGKHISRDMRS